MTDNIGNDYALNSVDAFNRSVLYLTEDQYTALTLSIAVTHAVRSFTTVPIVLAGSDKGESGKTTLLNVAGMLSDHGWKAKATSYAIESKFGAAYDAGHSITLIVDEISKIFGESGLNGRTNPLYTILCDRYQSNATTSRSVNRMAQDVSTYGVSFLGGLGNAVPADIATRCIKIRMSPAPKGVELLDSLDPSVELAARGTDEVPGIQSVLHSWVTSNAGALTMTARNGLRKIHPKLRARKRQIWGPLFAVAIAAGGEWPARCLSAFQSMALDESDRVVLAPAQQCLIDTGEWLRRTGAAKFTGREAIEYLRSIPGKGEFYSALSDQALANLLASAMGLTVDIREGNRVYKGRYASPVVESAQRLLAAIAPKVEDAEDDTLDMELGVTDRPADPLQTRYTQTPTAQGVESPVAGVAGVAGQIADSAGEMSGPSGLIHKLGGNK
jgi:hypothetical protein